MLDTNQSDNINGNAISKFAPSLLDPNDPRESAFQVLWVWFEELAADDVLMKNLNENLL